MDKLEHQPCPICHEKQLTLIEDEQEIPYFGKVFLFSMECAACKFRKADVEAAARKEPTKYTLEVDSEEDMKIRVVKSSEATVKIPQMKMSVTPGPVSEGYISNIEGVLTRFEKVIEDEKETAEDEDVKKQAQKLLKKLRRVKWGQEKLKIILEDPSGNSAIISEKAHVETLKSVEKQAKDL